MIENEGPFADMPFCWIPGAGEEEAMAEIHPSPLEERLSRDVPEPWNAARRHHADRPAGRPEPVPARIDLEGIDLVGLDLHGADLRGANLRGADLTDTDLSGANLAGADLTGANLTGANLTRAILQDAELAHGCLRGANLGHARLRGANLRSVSLAQANLEGAFLLGAVLRGARYDDQTRWPPGLDPRECGADRATPVFCETMYHEARNLSLRRGQGSGVEGSGVEGSGRARPP